MINFNWWFLGDRSHILRPENRNRASVLDKRRNTTMKSGAVHNLFGFDFIGYISVEIATSTIESCSSELRRSPGNQYEHRAVEQVRELTGANKSMD